MAVFKCKMCGGTLDVKDGDKIAVCEYCGTKQTIPSAKDNKVKDSEPLEKNNKHIFGVSFIIIIFIIALRTVNRVPNNKEYKYKIYTPTIENTNKSKVKEDLNENVKEMYDAINEMDYKRYVSNFENKQYDEAEEGFKKLNDYKESKEYLRKIAEARKEDEYQEYIKLFDEGNYEVAEDGFNKMNGYKDTNDYLQKIVDIRNEKEENYQNYVKAYESGDYDTVMNIYESVRGYKEADSYNEKLPFLYRAEAKTANSYDENTTVEQMETIQFGAYEQDNNFENGVEPLEWIILDKRDGKALITTKYIIDCKKYNNEYKSITWENCALRKWLKETFMSNAFTDTEKTYIQNEFIANDANGGVKAGNDTKDEIFCLSLEEVKKYFKSDTQRRTSATRYARKVENDGDNLYVESNSGGSHFWLRSPGWYQEYAAIVKYNGAIADYGSYVDNYENGVRPAMWISFDAFK